MSNKYALKRYHTSDGDYQGRVIEYYPTKAAAAAALKIELQYYRSHGYKFVQDSNDPLRYDYTSDVYGAQKWGMALYVELA